MTKNIKWIRKNAGIALTIAVMVGLFGFIGNYFANFLWWYQQQYPKYLILSGITSCILFFSLVIYFACLIRKWMN